LIKTTRKIHFKGFHFTFFQSIKTNFNMLLLLVPQNCFLHFEIYKRIQNSFFKYVVYTFETLL